METLVLNVAETPVSVIGVRHALRSVLSGRATARAYYNQKYSSSGAILTYDIAMCKNANREVISMPLPSVIQYTNSAFIPKRYTKTLPFNRRNVYIRDKGQCMYCGRKVSINSFTFDHVRPQYAGGTTCWKNIVVSCLKCNSDKSKRAIRHWKRKLIREPFAPKLDKAAPAHIVNKIALDIPHETWTDFIYWNIVLER